MLQPLVLIFFRTSVLFMEYWFKWYLFISTLVYWNSLFTFQYQNSKIVKHANTTFEAIDKRKTFYNMNACQNAVCRTRLRCQTLDPTVGLVGVLEDHSNQPRSIDGQRLTKGSMSRENIKCYWNAINSVPQNVNLNILNFTILKLSILNNTFF